MGAVGRVYESDVGVFAVSLGTLNTYSKVGFREDDN